MGDAASDVSLDSMASTTASDVLIRATSLHRRPCTVSGPLPPEEAAGSGACRVEHSQVAATGWQDRAHSLANRPPDFAFKKRDLGYVPPALPANKYPAVPITQKDDTRPSCTEQRTDSPAQKVLVTKPFPDAAEKKSVLKKPLEGGMQKSKDVHISEFITGQKETLLAALHRRAQSGPVTKQVPVMLLADVTAKDKKTGNSTEPTRESSEIHTATIAAATAAAIAAAAPALKVQNNLEAQVNAVSQLLQKLQEADRQLQTLTEQHRQIQGQPLESLYQGRVSELERQLSLLTEQRLQHLERLQQQQLDMQSQFMNSAIKVTASHREPSAQVCSHVPATVPLSRTAAPLKNSEKVTAPAVVETKLTTGKSPLETPAPRRFAPVPISMDEQVPTNSLLGKENLEEAKPSTSGNGHFLHELLGPENMPVSRSSTTGKSHNPLNLTTTDSRPFSNSYLQRRSPGGVPTSSVASSAAVQKADDVLQDLNMLKQEMQSMMMDAKQWKSQEAQLKPRKEPTFLSTSLSKSPVFWRRTVNPRKSMFEDAKRILREVQNNKKVLEDNLEAIARANDWARGYTLINALATDSDGAEKIRIQKLVDSWITDITSEIQDELAQKEKKSHESCKDSGIRKNAGSTKNMKDNRYRDIKAPVSRVMKTKPSSGVSAKPPCKKTGEKLAGQSNTVLPKKDGSSKVSQKVHMSSVMDEEMLNRVYGTPVYQGHRSTLKKGPYLRFGSPPAKPKPQRPKVLETVRGVKLKSAKIQTGFPEVERAAIKSRSPDFSVPKNYEPQYAFCPSGETYGSSAAMPGHLIEMAIPLGRPRVGSAAPLPSTVILASPQPIVNVSIPPMPLKPKADAVVKPNIAVVEMRSEIKDPPQLSVQVLPSVNIDSVTSDSPGPSHRTPSPDPPPRTPSPIKAEIQMPENVETEEEILAPPGISAQEMDFPLDDQVEEVPEPLLELNGCGVTNPPHCGGIPFPPPAPALQTNADILNGNIRRRETLVNRLVSRVEQEILDKVISEMHSRRQDIIHHAILSSSESSASVSSDSEAAESKSSWFLFDGVPIQSSLVRQYVKECVGETVALILAERSTRRVPASPPQQTVVQVPPIEIPLVPTPQCTPPASPLPSPREAAIVKTPELSPQTSVDDPDLQQEAAEGIPLSLVVTPTMTPVASPPRVNTPTSHVSEDNEEPSSIKSPLRSPWNNTELPLEEENPHSLKEAIQYRDAIVMTVAEEEPKCLISVTTPEPQKPIVHSRVQEVLSPAHSSSSSSTSSEESSVTVTESDTTDKPLSEGEVLYSYGQIIGPSALGEGGLVYPNLMESLSSTLRDANDMEFDPPSEGQVIDGPIRRAHHDPIRSLLAKLNQDSVARQEIFHLPESSGDENSMGEISEGQKPGLTAAAEQILAGPSAFMDSAHATGQTARHLRTHPSSHGSQMNIPGVRQRDAANISSGPMSLGDLESQLLPAYYPHAEDLHQIPAAARNTSQGSGEPQREHQPVPTRFIRVGVKSSDDPRQDILLEHMDITERGPMVWITSACRSGELLQSGPALVDSVQPSYLVSQEFNNCCFHLHTEQYQYSAMHQVARSLVVEPKLMVSIYAIRNKQTQNTHGT